MSASRQDPIATPDGLALVDRHTCQVGWLGRPPQHVLDPGSKGEVEEMMRQLVLQPGGEGVDVDSDEFDVLAWALARAVHHEGDGRGCVRTTLGTLSGAFGQTDADARVPVVRAVDALSKRSGCIADSSFERRRWSVFWITSELVHGPTYEAILDGLPVQSAAVDEPLVMHLSGAVLELVQREPDRVWLDFSVLRRLSGPAKRLWLQLEAHRVGSDDQIDSPADNIEATTTLDPGTRVFAITPEIYLALNVTEPSRERRRSAIKGALMDILGADAGYVDLRLTEPDDHSDNLVVRR